MILKGPSHTTSTTETSQVGMGSTVVTAAARTLQRMFRHVLHPGEEKEEKNGTAVANYIEEKCSYQLRAPREFMGEKITATNDFACFSWKIIILDQGGRNKLETMPSSRYQNVDLMSHLLQFAAP